MNAGSHAKERTSPLKSVLSFLLMVLAVFAITVCLRLFVFVPYEIPSGSMEETIMTGDMIFSEKVTYYVREPRYGDIVTFEDPEVEGRTLIKRIIATGGQTVDMMDGKVVVDGVALEEHYTDGKESFPLSRSAAGVVISYPYTVPEGCAWVMGDNRTASQDSRYFGAIELSSISGKAALVYWPFSDFGLLE